MGLPFENVKRTILTRKRSRSDPKFGCTPDERPVEELINYGIINLNKPSGPTSHQVSAYVQKILGLSKAGHSGTLDPKVCGVLPVALGRGTRIVQALLNAGKEYICLMHVHQDIEEEKIREVLKGFIGKMRQLPPVRSAVKRQWRNRRIYYLEVLNIEGRDVLFKVGCQAGTYMRKLCTDVGQKLGTGAHMAELVRTKAGPFKGKDVVTLQDIRDSLWYYKNKGNEKFIRSVILPIEAGVAHLGKVWVLDSTVESLTHGMNLAVPGISKMETDIQVGEMVAVLSLKNELVCIGETKMISREMKEKAKGIAVRVDKVFMNSGVYPKVKKIEKED